MQKTEACFNGFTDRDEDFGDNVSTLHLDTVPVMWDKQNSSICVHNQSMFQWFMWTVNYLSLLNLLNNTIYSAFANSCHHLFMATMPNLFKQVPIVL